MDLTVLNKSAETARMSRGRSSSERSASSPTHYNSKSLERPKKQKVTQKKSTVEGSAVTVQNLSGGKSMGSGLDGMDNDGNVPVEPQPTFSRAMSSEHTTHLTAVPHRLRTTTSPPVMVPTERHSMGPDDFGLSRNSMLAESYRFAVDKYPQMTSRGPTDNPAKRELQCKAAIEEIKATERSYVLLLNDILKGYRDPLTIRKHELPIKWADANILFSEIKEIKDFSKGLLESLINCGNDLKAIGECFSQTWSSDQQGCQLYTKYCTKYPKAIEVYSRWYLDSTMCEFFRRCQHQIGHPLPLGSDLLEPVQRVQRYHIMLMKILKNLKVGEEGYCEIKAAHETMTNVAVRINEMKGKHDDAVRVQELQSQLQGWPGNDLTFYGELLIKETLFKYYFGRGTHIPFRGTEDRSVFLFKKLILLTKKRDEVYKYKGHIEWKDLQLIENVDKYPNSFQVRQLSNASIHTFHARNEAVKAHWVVSIKRMIMESIPELNKRIKPTMKDLLLKGAKKTDITADNISGDFRHSTKSSSMQGLNEIRSRENSPKNGTSRLAMSMSAKVPHSIKGGSSASSIHAKDDSSLPRRSSSTDRVRSNRFSSIETDDTRSRVSDSGIVMENTQKAEGKPQRMAHAPLSHSRSTVIGRTHPQEEPRLPRNLSDSHVQEPFGKSMVSPADSMYSSDSIGSLDQLETGETDSYSNPSGDVGLGGIDISLTDTPAPGSPLPPGTKLRSSGRKRKPRPSSFVETDDIPEHGILGPSPQLCGSDRSASSSTEPPHPNSNLGISQGVSQSSLFSDSIFASVDSQWGDKLIRDLFYKETESAQVSNDLEGVDIISPANHSEEPLPPGIQLRRQKPVSPRSEKLHPSLSNQLGQELQEDLFNHLHGDRAMYRPSIDQDIAMTYFGEMDSNSLKANPVSSSSEENLLVSKSGSATTLTLSESGFPLLSPPESFRLESNLETDGEPSEPDQLHYSSADPLKPGMSSHDSGSEVLPERLVSPAVSDGFFTPVASPELYTGKIPSLDLPQCDVAPIPRDNSAVETLDPPELPVTSNDKSPNLAKKRSSVTLSISSNGSFEFPMATDGSSTSTPEFRRRGLLERTRPLSLCSADSQSSTDSSPAVLSRGTHYTTKSSLATTASVAMVTALDDQVYLPPPSDFVEALPDPPSTSDRPTGVSLRRDSLYSYHSAEINFDSESTTQPSSESVHSPGSENNQLTLDEILQDLDKEAQNITWPNPKNKGGQNPPAIVIDPGSSEVKRRHKPKMSPARRHTVSDMKLLRELEEGKKSKSPSSRVKKIAREYSRLSKEGHLTRRFKSFTSPSGYQPLDSPQIQTKLPEWKLELTQVKALTLDDSEDEQTAPWKEEFKQIREMRKSQSSPSNGSFDSVLSAPPSVSVRPPPPPHQPTSNQAEPSDDQPSPAVPSTSYFDPLPKESSLPIFTAKESPRERKLSLPPEVYRPGKGKKGSMKSKSRSSLGPTDEYSSLFAMKELSKSTDFLPLKTGSSSARPSFFSPRQTRSSKSFRKASDSPSVKRAQTVMSDTEDGGSSPTDTKEYEEIRRKGGLRGFVKNIVDRFSGKH